MRQCWCVRAWAKGQTALALFITSSKTVPGVRPRVPISHFINKTEEQSDVKWRACLISTGPQIIHQTMRHQKKISLCLIPSRPIYENVLRDKYLGPKVSGLTNFLR